MYFTPVRFIPASIPGKSTSPKFRGREVNGVHIEITDYAAVMPVETGLAVVAGLYDAIKPEQRKLFFRRGFDDLAGSVLLRQSTLAGKTVQENSLKLERRCCRILRR